MHDSLLAEVETAIREYLRERPDSADTLEGIHRWWIRWPDRPESPALTEIALERLEADGLLERFRVGDNVVWRRRGASGATAAQQAAPEPGD
jgi:hypothetical protein